MVRLIAAFVLLLILPAPAAWAQTVTGTRLAVGAAPTPPDASTMRITGLGTTGGTGLLWTDAEGDVIKRALARVDLPAGIAWVDQANAFTQANTFAGATTFNGAATFNAGLITSGQRGTVDPWVVNDTAGAPFLQAYDGGLFRMTRAAAASVWIDYLALGAPAGARKMRLGNFGGHFVMQTMNDAESVFSDAWRVIPDSNGSGYAREVTFGGTVQSVRPATGLYTRLGAYLNPFSVLHVGELRAAAMVINETQAYTEASLKVGRGSTLTRSRNTADTWFFSKTIFTRYLDFLILRTIGANGQPQFEVVQVTSGATADCTGAVTPLPGPCAGLDNDDYAFLVGRNLDGTGADAWEKGDAIVSMDRWLDMFSDSGGVLSYGNAVLGDRPVFYTNFPYETTGTPNLAAGPRGYSGPKSIVFPNTAGGVSTCGYGGWTAASDEYGCGAWVPTTTSSVWTPGNMHLGETQHINMAYAQTVEMVWHTAGGAEGAYAVNPYTKWNNGDTTTANVVMYYFGAAAGAAENQIMFYGANNGAWTTLTGAVTISKNTWYHMVFTWDTYNGGRIYLNGVLQPGTVYPNATPGSNLGPAGSPVTLSGSPSMHFSELAIYDYALSAEAVAAHYNGLRSARWNTVNGPTAVGSVATGTNWYDQAPRWAVGNLQGMYNYATETYGLAAGDSTKNWLAVDPGQGVRMMGGNVPRVWLNPNGTLQMFDENGARGVYLNAASGLVLGGDSIVVGKPYGQFTATQFALCASNTNCTVRFDGTSGNMTSTGSILLSTGGNVTSTNAFRLAQTTGLEVVRASSNSWNNTNAVSFVPAIGSPASLALWQATDGTHRLEQLAAGSTLVIGDNPIAYDSMSTTIRLWNNGGYSGAPLNGQGIDLTADGLWFRAFHSFTGDQPNKHIRPTTDADLYLGSQAYRFKNAHFSLPQAIQAPVSYVVVNNGADLSSMAYWNQGYAAAGAIAISMTGWGGGNCHLYVTNGLIYYSSCPTGTTAELEALGSPALPQDIREGRQGPKPNPPIDYIPNEPNAPTPPPLIPDPLPWPDKETPVITPLEPLPPPVGPPPGKPENPGAAKPVTPGPPVKPPGPPPGSPGGPPITPVNPGPPPGTPAPPDHGENPRPPGNPCNNPPCNPGPPTRIQ